MQQQNCNKLTVSQPSPSGLLPIVLVAVLWRRFHAKNAAEGKLGNEQHCPKGPFFHFNLFKAAWKKQQSQETERQWSQLRLRPKEGTGSSQEESTGLLVLKTGEMLKGPERNHCRQTRYRSAQDWAI